MKKSKLIISILIVVLIVCAAVVINLKVYDFYTPVMESIKGKSAPVAAAKPAEVKPQTDANQKSEEVAKGDTKVDKEAMKAKFAGRRKGGKVVIKEEMVKEDAVKDVNETKKTADSNKPAEPNGMVALNLKDVEMKDLIAKISEWTGKVIVPTEDEIMKKKITIYATSKVSKTRALSLIYSALNTRGVIVEESNDTIYLKTGKNLKFGVVPLIPADQPLASIENKNIPVQKFFKPKSYKASQLQKAIAPLISENGYVSSDESTGQLIIIDTVTNLMRIERIIEQLDVPQAQEMSSQMFELKEGDPVEIVQLLKLLLVDKTGKVDSGGDSGGKPGGAPAPVTAGGGKIILIPVPERKWIIAKGSANDIAEVGRWIEKLDNKKPEQREYTIRKVDYVDVKELADRIGEMIERMPGKQLKSNVMVQPLVNAKQLMIIGSPENREMVGKLVDEIDIPTGRFQTEHIKLKYADPDMVKKNVEDLYKEIMDSEYSSSWYSYRRRESFSRPGDAGTVRVISFPSLKQVTVIASADNMEKVKQQILEWDKPIDVNEVVPLIIELKNSDPVQMASLMTKLFSETEEGGRSSFFRMFFGGEEEEQKKKIVGPLYGQLTFEAYPESKKLIVISKIPEAYEVVKKLITELDKQEMAEVPVLITLNYADPEDLCERLNSIFSKEGALAKFHLSETGLSDRSGDNRDSQNSQSSQSSNKNTQSSTTERGEYQPPWTQSRPNKDEAPVSNVIGKIRFVPDPRSKAILTLAPPEYISNIVQMVKELDKPGQQVMIKAIVLAVDHSNMTSLGLQLSSDPASFGNIGENAATSLVQLSMLEKYGSITLGVNTSVTALVDFLIKKTDAKVLNQQTLWTKDNAEADFFKGQTVAFIKDSSTSSEGGRLTQTFTYERVGMTLRIRPNITPEKKVNMTINIVMSDLGTELINNQPVRSEMDTKTNMIVQDAQTSMLGGILFQRDSNVERKLPLLGDLPGVGGAFRHYDVIKANTEMIIFITPYVIGDQLSEMQPKTAEELKKAEDKLDKVLKELADTLDANETAEKSNKK